MKIIIAGGGKVGETLTRQLTAEGHDITLVDRSSAVLEAIMENYDVIGVEGNAASMATLAQAGIQGTDLLIAATDADEVNLLTCLTAHNMNPDLQTIARIRNPEYREQSYQMRDKFALNMIINPEENAAQEIARLLQFPGFLKIDTFARGATEIAEFRIKKDSKLNGLVLNRLNTVVRSQVLVCAVQRDSQCIMPDGGFTLQENDLVFVTASQNNLSSMLKNIGVISRKAKNALITGGGRISYYLASELENSGIKATIIEKSEARCNELASSLKNTTIVHGDASSQPLLDSEGIAGFDAFVTLTDLDELNIVMSLYGSERGVPQVITKLSHAENNRVLTNLSVGSIISPKELICASIVRYVRSLQNKEGAAVSMHMIADGKGEAIEFVVDKDTRHIGETLNNIHIRHNVLVAGITRGWLNEIPTGSSTFREGDTVVVVTNGDTKILQLNDIFED